MIRLKDLQASFDITNDVAKRLYRLLNDNFAYRAYMSYAELPVSSNIIANKMSVIGHMLGMHGVEVIESTDYNYSNYWHNAVAVYCNSGDTYNATILYCLKRNKFYLTTVGDYVEKNSSKYNIN